MRRSIFILSALSAFSSFALLACEDGPNQTFTPAPANAANLWNNSGADASVFGAAQGYGAGASSGGAGTNAEVICTGAQEAKRWATMVREPLVPPRYVAGLDLAGGDSWPGLTIAEAEQINCQSESLGDIFGQNGILSNSWGDNQEVIFTYYTSNNKAWMTYIQPGYTGDIGCNGNEPGDSPSGACQQLTSRDGKHTYQIPMGSQIQKDGANFEIDWLDPVNGPLELNELADALMSTYAPQLPAEPNCIGDGHCIENITGSDSNTYFFVLPLGIAMSPASRMAAQPVPSIMTNFQLYVTKVLGYAYANPLLVLNQTGPTAPAGLLGSAAQDCTLGFGMTYANFLSNCVETTGNPSKNTVELNKLLGGLFHDDESFTFNVQGVDVNFKSATLAPNLVLGDNAYPQPADLSVELSMDQNTLGNILNDYTDMTGTKLDLHGSGAVYKEYARLVRKTLLADAGIQDGDTSKCLFANTNAGNAVTNPTAYYANLHAQYPWCTGMEGFITAAPSGGPTDLTNLGYAGAISIGSTPSTTGGPPQPGQLSKGLKPGNIYGYFCADANGPAGLVPSSGGATSGYNLCGINGDPFGAYGSLWKTSYNQVLKVFGQGSTANLPIDVQDVRFFWKEFVTALVEYLYVGDKFPAVTGVPLPDLSTIPIDGYSIFFDSNGAGQFETAEYVDRRFVTAGQAPLDMQVTADVKDGIFDEFDFTRYLERGETAVYTAMTVNPNDALGAEDTALVTNIFGNPILKAWPAGTVSSAYQCASTVPPPADCPPNAVVPSHVTTTTCSANTDCAAGQWCDGVNCEQPTLNSEGDPVLKPYPGAFGATAFSLGPVDVKIVEPQPNTNQFYSQQAEVTVPTWTNPYDQTSPPGPPITKLLPWVPLQPGNGFNIPVNGELNQFITTANVDLSGITISAYVYYTCQIDSTTGQCATNGAVQFDGFFSSDFLGDVILCQDPNTGDLLTAQMYTAVGDMLNFLATHPTVYTSCGLIIRYSPYDNYADYITSLNNGVQVEVTQGGGYGRIVGATLFTPGQGTGG